MNTICTVLAYAIFLWLVVVTAAFTADLNGIWTKTTNPDPDNVAIFYNEKMS